MLTLDEKSSIIKKFAASTSDTGSPQVQVGLLTAQIEKLASHLREHRGDNHSRRGLLRIVSKRRRLLSYLAKTNVASFQKLVKDLKITSPAAN